MIGRAESFEVGPRDGLPNELRGIPVAGKITLIDLLTCAGVRRIEVGTFVSPRAVPQMADSAKVIAGVPGISCAALTPNLRGFEAARAAGVDEIADFTSASDGLNRANLGATNEESLDRYASVAEASHKAHVLMRGYVSCLAVCPYHGPTSPAEVARLAAALDEMGCYEISLGDTTGQATPEQIRNILETVLERVPADRLAGHFHDTSGTALEKPRGDGRPLPASVRCRRRWPRRRPFCARGQGQRCDRECDDPTLRDGVEIGLDARVVAEAARMARRMARGGETT